MCDSVGRPRKKVDTVETPLPEVETESPEESVPPETPAVQEEGASEFSTTVRQTTEGQDLHTPDASAMEGVEATGDGQEADAGDEEDSEPDPDTFKWLEFPSLIDAPSWCWVPQAIAQNGILRGDDGMLNFIENWGEDDLKCLLDEVVAAKTAAVDRAEVLKVLTRIVLKKLDEPVAGQIMSGKDIRALEVCAIPSSAVCVSGLYCIMFVSHSHLIFLVVCVCSFRFFSSSFPLSF